MTGRSIRLILMKMAIDLPPYLSLFDDSLLVDKLIVLD